MLHQPVQPPPGLALPRPRQGRPDLAHPAIRAALLAETTNPLARARSRVAHAEIALAADDRTAAQEAVAELADVAARCASPVFPSAARQWCGALLLASGATGEALPVLSAACTAGRQLDAVYDCARVRMLLAGAYRWAWCRPASGC